MDGLWKSLWLGPAAVATLVAASGGASAQETATPPTTSPEVVIEAPEPPTAPPTTAPTPGAPTFAPPPATAAEPAGIPAPAGVTGSVTGSVLEGTIFDSGPATGYTAENSTTGTIFNLPRVDSPVTTDVVTRDVLNDQRVLNTRDLVRNVPSAVIAGDAQFPDRIFLRGLQVNAFDYRKNGFVDPTFTPRDFQNVDRVEIVKGPASVVYGSGSASGTVNFITKKPIDDQFAVGGYEFGSFGLSRFTGDVNGYVNEDGTILYRLNVADETGNSFRELGFQDRYQIAPVVTFLLDEDTTLTWDSEIVDNRRRGDQGIPAIGGLALAVPSDRFYGLSSDAIQSNDYRTSLLLTRRLSDVWTFNAGVSTIQYRFDGQTTAAATPVPVLPGIAYDRTTSTFRDHESATSGIVNLAADFEGPLFEHKFLAGSEHVYYDSNSSFSLDEFSTSGFLPPIGTFTFGAPVFRQVRNGFYLQDYVTLNEHWSVLSGVRFDTFDLEYERYQTFTGVGLISRATTEQTFNRTSPRVGVVYHPLADTNWSLYGNYSQSFSPPSGGAFPAGNAPVLPETGENYEAGTRAELLPGLLWDLSAFHVTRQNIPLNVGILYLQAGQERGQGVETSLTGQLTRRWSAIANAAYTDTRLTDPNDPVTFFGQRNRNVPRQSGSLWTRYNLIDDDFRTFGLAMGVVYVGDRSANIADTVELPAYVRYDAGVYYVQGRINSSVYIENLFDRNYALGSLESTGLVPGFPAQVNVLPGAPINARANVWFTF